MNQENKKVSGVENYTLSDILMIARENMVLQTTMMDRWRRMLDIESRIEKLRYYLSKNYHMWPVPQCDIDEHEAEIKGLLAEHNELNMYFEGIIQEEYDRLKQRNLKIAIQMV